MFRKIIIELLFNKFNNVLNEANTEDSQGLELFISETSKIKFKLSNNINENDFIKFCNNDENYKKVISSTGNTLNEETYKKIFKHFIKNNDFVADSNSKVLGDSDYNTTDTWKKYGGSSHSKSKTDVVIGEYKYSVKNKSTPTQKIDASPSQFSALLNIASLSVPFVFKDLNKDIEKFTEIFSKVKINLKNILSSDGKNYIGFFDDSGKQKFHYSLSDIKSLLNYEGGYDTYEKAIKTNDKWKNIIKAMKSNTYNDILKKYKEYRKNNELASDELKKILDKANKYTETITQQEKFLKAFWEESLSGKIMFGENSEATANYLFNISGKLDGFTILSIEDAAKHLYKIEDLDKYISLSDMLIMGSKSSGGSTSAKIKSKQPEEIIRAVLKNKIK